VTPDSIGTGLGALDQLRELTAQFRIPIVEPKGEKSKS